MRFSVIICTLNRARLVADSLASVLAQSPSSELEAVVVDNGSSDDTVAVLSSVRDDRLVVLHEPVLGLSRARNTGLRESRGEIVVFLDDDAVAEPGWLEAIEQVFRDEPAAAAVGGPSRLVWPKARPSWLAERYESYYSAVDYGEVRRRLVYPRIPYGVNMAFRREWLIRGGAFDVELGRRGSNLVSCEEQALFRRLDLLGAEVWYEPQAAVRHVVQPERTTRRWLARRAYYQGWTHSVLPSLRVDWSADEINRTRPLPVPRFPYRLGMRLAYELGRFTGVLGRR